MCQIESLRLALKPRNTAKPEAFLVSECFLMRATVLQQGLGCD